MQFENQITIKIKRGFPDFGQKIKSKCMIDLNYRLIRKHTKYFLQTIRQYVIPMNYHREKFL